MPEKTVKIGDKVLVKRGRKLFPATVHNYAEHRSWDSQSAFLVFVNRPFLGPTLKWISSDEVKGVVNKYDSTD